MITYQNLTSIHPEAKIGNNVTIEPFTTICKDVEIGHDTWIGPNVTIMDGARIGSSCKIFPGAVISAVPQDLKFNNELSMVEIGNYTTIRECVTINRGTAALGITKVGSNCLIMAYCHIAHDCLVGDYSILSNNTTLAGHVEIGRGSVLSGLTAIQQFCSVGEFSFVAGGSRVRKDIPPYVKSGKDPLVFLGINSVGLKRNNFSSDQIKNIENMYRYIYNSKKNISQALEEIEKNFDASFEKNTIVSFLKKSRLGILKSTSK
ncbi:MAG: acyl-ACP--UDP-N-acetylglucosamine O-acyltransferase [Flavobacteriaceae bacterium]